MSGVWNTTTRDVRGRSGYLDNLQILRAFAALNVVAYHAIITAHDYSLGDTGLNWLSGWGKPGSISSLCYRDS